MTARRLPIQDAVSAGGIVWRKAADGGLEVVVCGRQRLWGLPKGTPDAGEAIEQTALREVREETGLEVALGPKIGSIEYWFTSGGTRFHKFVHHWLMTPTGGDVADHDHEFDAVEWMPLERARRLLSYQNERRMLDDAVRLLDGAA
ncbi:MAG: NUDIX hydrolase [Chloroflexi bacterium]|nr:NUDIX hydrolase [Chloroflexota bacterium]